MIGELCQYKIIWRRRGKGCVKKWYLDEQSVLHHKDMCPSGPKISQRELLEDTNVRRFLHAAPEAKGNELSEFAARSVKSFCSSVSLRTAYRAKNRVLQQATAYYMDDWCKLAEWGRDFKKLNPGSCFILKKDSRNRYVGMPYVLMCSNEHVLMYVLK